MKGRRSILHGVFIWPTSFSAQQNRVPMSRSESRVYLNSEERSWVFVWLPLISITSPLPLAINLQWKDTLDEGTARTLHLTATSWRRETLRDLGLSWQIGGKMTTRGLGGELSLPSKLDAVQK